MVASKKARITSHRRTCIFKLGELFCGPGGLAWGAKETSIIANNCKYGISHAWATDYDQDSCATYAKNICNGNPKSVVCADIQTFKLSKLAAISSIDALAFGFPCNDFSVVGEQKGINGNFGPLYSYAVKALKKFRPQWFLAENVGGLRNANEGKTFRTILKELYDAGYSLYPHLYSFAKYGIPQIRQRIIIVGIRKDVNVTFQIPSPETYKLYDISCRHALESLPISCDAENHEQTVQAQQVIQRLKWIKPGENAFTANLPDSLKLNVRGAKISQIYKRLDPEKPAYTVTGSGGGGTHMYHWTEPRALTNRERARLQTFPDSFRFCGSKESVRKQIGMAVPCMGAKVIFEALLSSFAGVNYPSVYPSDKPWLYPEHLPTYNGQAGMHQETLFERRR